MRNSYHRDAVTVLQSVEEEVVMEVAYIADLVSDNSDDEGEQQQPQQLLSTRHSSMPPQNEVDSLNSASSESEYDSPDSSVEPNHVPSISTTSLPPSALPSSSLPSSSPSLPSLSSSLPMPSASVPVSSASVLCKPRRATTQQHQLMASFGAPHNGLEANRQMAHPDDHSDENSNFNNSANGGIAQYANYANFYTDNPYATVVSAIELGPDDMPKGKNKPARV